MDVVAIITDLDIKIDIMLVGEIMNIRLLVLSLLIVGCCSDSIYGAGINARTKNSIQHRQARQVKAAKELKKRSPQKKKLTDRERILAAIETLKDHAPSRKASWRYWGYMSKLELLERALQGEDIGDRGRHMLDKLIG